MKRFAFVMVFVVLVAFFAAYSTRVSAGSVQAPPPDPIPLTFQDAAGTPYCDGMNLDHNLPTNYQIGGAQCGCVTGAIGGSFVGANNQIVPTGTGAIVMIPDWQIYTKITFNPRAWAHYNVADGSLVNSGTFAFGCPVVDGGTNSLGK